MGKVRSKINGLNFLGPRESAGAWITMNDGQDLGPVAIMINSGSRSGGHSGAVIGGKGEIETSSFSKKVDEGGITYSVNFTNLSDFVVVPEIEIAWSDT